MIAIHKHTLFKLVYVEIAVKFQLSALFPPLTEVKCQSICVCNDRGAKRSWAALKITPGVENRCYAFDICRQHAFYFEVVSKEQTEADERQC